MKRVEIIRRIWETATRSLEVYEDEGAPIQIPKDRFLAFSDLPRGSILEDLVRAYQTVFAEPPWKEEWRKEEVLTKLQGELVGDCFLLVMRGNEEFPIGGFSWGAILLTQGLEIRIGAALGKEPKGLEEVLLNRGIKKAVYFDEIAVLKPFRRGLDCVRFLSRPALEIGYQRGVLETLFWSTPESQIVPLALYSGYEEVFCLKVKGKKIIFFLNSNFQPLLKAMQNLGEISGARILGRSRKARC